MRGALFLGAATALFSLATVGAQTPGPPIWQGVYSAAQAERGRGTFLTTCQRCHGADLAGNNGPALRGERFMTTWGGGSVTRLFEKIRDTMPPFATSTLDDATKLDVVAFILQSNGFPAARNDLALGDLESIQVVAQGEQLKVQNFARVQVVGCLARGGDTDKWVLTGASEPAVATDNAPVSSGAGGTGRVVLINAGQFNPDAQVGQRVDARGLIYREGGESLLAVTALKSTGPC